MNNAISASVVVLWFAIVIAAISGWIANVVKLIGMIHDPITNFFIVRVVGVFVPPIGSVLGYL